MKNTLIAFLKFASRFLACLVLLIFSLAPLSAQTPAPARPADPHQPIPAQPVEPSPATPTPASSSGTNASTATASQVSLAIIADSSLRQVLQELAQSWADTQETSPQVPLTLTNAGTMLAKVEGEATWDLVISADVQDAKTMTDKGVLLADGQRSLARNSLVIYGRKALIQDDELDWFDLIGSEWKKVAMGNPDLVASGRSARRALQKHGLIDDEHKKVYVYASTETLALDIASREQADAVFAYKTDVLAASLPGFATVPLKSDDAPPIFYTAAVCRLAKNQAMARAFIDYCTGDAAKEIWAKYGFETN